MGSGNLGATYAVRQMLLLVEADLNFGKKKTCISQ